MLLLIHSSPYKPSHSLTHSLTLYSLTHPLSLTHSYAPPGTLYSRHVVLEEEGEMDVVADSTTSGTHPSYHTKKHTNTGAKPAYQSFLGQVQ